MEESRKTKFEQLLVETREEITHIEAQIEKELDEFKERLAILEREKKAQLTIYGGYCQLLGIHNEFATEDDEDD